MIHLLLPPFLLACLLAEPVSANCGVLGPRAVIPLLMKWSNPNLLPLPPRPHLLKALSPLHLLQGRFRPLMKTLQPLLNPSRLLASLLLLLVPPLHRL